MSKKNIDDFKKRVVSEQKCSRRITNKELVCKDCKHKYDDSKVLGNTSRCEMYESKPNKVLLGGNCDEFERA